MKKFGLCMMCVLSVFISCDDDDDDHHHRRDNDHDSSYRQQWQEQENIICASLEYKSVQKNAY